MNERDAFQSYAEAAAAYEAAKDHLEQLKVQLDDAEQEALDAHNDVALPVVASLPDGRQVTINMDRIDGPYFLTYEISERL